MPMPSKDTGTEEAKQGAIQYAKAWGGILHPNFHSTPTHH